MGYSPMIISMLMGGLTNAYLILDQIIILMNRYSETSMQIEVHTDNIGQAANNLRISQSHVLSCWQTTFINRV